MMFHVALNRVALRDAPPFLAFSFLAWLITAARINYSEAIIP